MTLAEAIAIVQEVRRGMASARPANPRRDAAEELYEALGVLLDAARDAAEVSP